MIHYPRSRSLLIALVVGFLLGSGIPGVDAPIALAPDHADMFSGLSAKPALAGPNTALPPFTFRIPASMDRSAPATVLLLLHGMNASGSEMMNSFADEADRNGWILLAPQMKYRDWTNPDQVRLDESELLPALRALLDSAPESIGMRLKPKAVVFGFSRGAQLAQRFALAYPDSVKGVVTASAGTYTLPVPTYKSDQGEQPLLFPYGVADLARYSGHPFELSTLKDIPFYVTVGAQDSRSADVPRQWDRYLGTTRVERAQSFVQAMNQLGLRAELNIVPQADHEVTSVMQHLGCEFLRQIVS